VKICPVCSQEFSRENLKCPEDGVLLVSLHSGTGERPEELIGQVVEGRYRIDGIIGKGGMGTVFSCTHVVVGKRAAIKVLKPGVERSEDVLQRFVREAQAANSVESRHIVEMSDFGQLPSGAFYMVMELLHGQSFTKLMRTSELTNRQLLHIFIQIADALHHAHAAGIVHRDLKPDNVLLVEEGGDPLFVKLLDFGIAKFLHQDATHLTETGVILGTPYYMSPEQARAEAVDHRTDVYSVGVMMYRAFTGRLPFLADSAMGVLTAHLTEMPEIPSRICNLDVPTEHAILRCLEKRPADRFQSMEELGLTLRGILAPEAHQTFQDPSSGVYPMLVSPEAASEMKYGAVSPAKLGGAKLGGSVGQVPTDQRRAAIASDALPTPQMSQPTTTPWVAPPQSTPIPQPPPSIPQPPPSVPPPAPSGAGPVVHAGTPYSGVPAIEFAVGPSGLPTLKHPGETGTGAALVTSQTGRLRRLEKPRRSGLVVLGSGAMLIAGAGVAFALFGLPAVRGAASTDEPTGAQSSQPVDDGPVDSDAEDSDAADSDVTDDDVADDDAAKLDASASASADASAAPAPTYRRPWPPRPPVEPTPEKTAESDAPPPPPPPATVPTSGDVRSPFGKK